MKFFGMNTNNSVRSVILILLLVLSLKVYGAGELDTGFNASVYGLLNARVNAVKIQPDGKVLVGGFFTDAGGYAASGLVRLNADGTADTSFNAPDFSGAFGVGYQVNAIALQSDGKILVGGLILSADGVFLPGVRRLNANGSVDASFTVIALDAAFSVEDIEIQPDGKILVGGMGTGIYRTNADGTLDAEFTPSVRGNTSFGVKDIEIQPDGKILIAGGGSSVGLMRRLTPIGASDPTFFESNITGGSVETIELRPDGKILMGGFFTEINSFFVSRICLLTTTGSIDGSFFRAAPAPVFDIVLKPDGKVLVGGSFLTYGGENRYLIAQLNADGSVDTSVAFESSLNSNAVLDIELAPDGKVFAGFLGNTNLQITSLSKFNADGTRDATFSTVINRGGRVSRVLTQTDGKILVAGEFPRAGGARRNSLARFNADGTLDQSFVPYFNDNAQIPSIFAMALQPDGKILVGLRLGDFYNVRRLNPDGSQDAGFVSPGSNVIYDVAVKPNGKILFGGFISSTQGFLTMLNADGSLIGTIETSGGVYKIHALPDNRALIGGEFISFASVSRRGIVRILDSGAVDTTFAPAGGANGPVYDLDVQADGKVVLGGAFTTLNGSANQVKVGRLNSDGSLDASFVQATNGDVNAVKIQPDGKILIGGTMSAVQSAPHNGIARLNADGTVDADFNTRANTTVGDINLQADGKILIGGSFSKINNLPALRIARLLNNPAVPLRSLFDYDGDGRADVSVFRSSENKWYVRQSSTALTTQNVFAVAGDVAAPADYDGDGKTDVAIFRPSTGDWWYLSSVNGAQVNFRWGQAGDVPRPSDFDGDGRADFIVYRPSNSVWYRYGSTGTTSILAFGIAEDKPLIGDFDGDGKSDIAVFRPSTGDWWYAASSNNNQFRAAHWGAEGDVAAPADYDGDGKTDFAVFRPSNGGWYISNSSTGSPTILGFGLQEDKPVPADYDGDGKADIAVFRPSTGTWYLMQSSLGFGALQFGIATDLPTEAAFLP